MYYLRKVLAFIKTVSVCAADEHILCFIPTDPTTIYSAIVPIVLLNMVLGMTFASLVFTYEHCCRTEKCNTEKGFGICIMCISHGVDDVDSMAMLR